MLVNPTFLLCSVLACLSLPLQAGQKLLVVGDSLTKEYEAEFPALFPSNPPAWEARNWAEVLQGRRSSHFDLGSWSTYGDLRLTGHEFNWAKPGATAREYRNFLRQDAAAEEEIATGAAAALWPFFPSWRADLQGHAANAQKVVVFFGGNDLASGNTDPEANPTVGGSVKRVTYQRIYEGTHGEGSNPDLLRNAIRKNIRSIVEWFRNPVSNGGTARFSGPMVLCAVPHVGCTPKIQSETGTNATKTAVLTQMIERLNSELAAFAATWDVAFADTYSVTKRVLDPAPYEIGGVRFFKQADADCRPRYLFSGDGFHPNTAAHAEMAQIIAQTFLNAYPQLAGAYQPITDRQILTQVLGIPADTGFKEWLTENNVATAKQGPFDDPDADGLPNVLEYALAARNPALRDAVSPLEVRFVSGKMRVSWRPRFSENAYTSLTLEASAGMTGGSWTAVPSGQLAAQTDGSMLAELPIGSATRRFVRLRATVIP
jgi:lysophospholipase L1-like esterase